MDGLGIETCSGESKHFGQPMFHPGGVAKCHQQKELLDEVFHEGHPIVPTEWIEAHRKAHLKWL